MTRAFEIVLLTLAAGSCIFFGGLLACVENIRPKWIELEFRHFVVAFGGGVLLGAVTLVLVPEGIGFLDSSTFVVPIILLGGLVFFFVEQRLGKSHVEKPQLLAMLLDFIPEALALGGLVALGTKSAPLLAFLIGLQNFPEGFNAFRELNAGDTKATSRTLITMALIALLGPVCGLLGFYFLSRLPIIIGGIMLFAAGGILYLIFQDIAPQSKLEKHWGPPLGAVFGFCLALGGDLLFVG